MPTILAIESSCDDTGAAVIQNGTVRSNVVRAQLEHGKYGGVIPELASRAHQESIVPVVHTALERAKVSKNDLDAVAFTQGPGLMGSLLVGASFAKGMAQALGIPLLAVDHLHAHIAAHFIEHKEVKLPMLCLLVSGGHTQIIRIDEPLRYEILGRTTDDAAGEAFDKAAKLLGLPYPGGPMIDAYAKEGDPHRFSFPEPHAGGLDFSFSGLKTSFLYFLRDNVQRDPDFIQKNLNDICASYQERIVTYLLHRLRKAVEETGIRSIGLAGGVAANSGLRRHLEDWAKAEGHSLHIPSFQYCTDNAAMVAKAGELLYLEGRFSGLEVAPYARKGE